MHYPLVRILNFMVWHNRREIMTLSAGFTVTEQIEEKDREALMAGLGSYNRQFTGSENRGPLAVFYRG